MCEITCSNFKEKLPHIIESLEKAKFVAIDLEFSALQPVQLPRLFDNNKERYFKLRQNLLNVIPLQVGITPFYFDNDTDDYLADVFTFYVSPAAFGDIDKSYYFQASTTNFLRLHDFDFNKFAYSGISYLNNEEETKIRNALKSGDLLGENCQMHQEFRDVIKVYIPIVSKWFAESKTGDILELSAIKKYEHTYELVYFIHQHLRKRFSNLWTFQKEGSFYLKKVTDAQLETLKKDCTLDEDIVNDLIGFKHVFDAMVRARKPIIGHNVLQDLMIMINNFHTILPDSYSQYKSLLHSTFPVIFDTKTLYYELRAKIPKEKLPEDTSLRILFEYFKDGMGRHLVMNTTAIECNIDPTKIDNYHNAGWDSYCTGYIFLRMAYYNIAGKYPKNKKFVTSEIINGLSEYKNRVNVIRGACSYISIDGEDPTSTRPPWLIVESLKNEPLDVSDLMSTLSSYGFVDIKKFSTNGEKVLVAVDNHRAAREISKTFMTNPKFKVKQYNVLRHSRFTQAVLLGAMTISGTLLIWLGHTMVKR